MPEQDPPVGTDPGGAHAKGFTAETPSPAPTPPAGPIPVADAPAGVIVTRPGYDGPIPPTGRDDADDDGRIGTRL